MKISGDDAVAAVAAAVYGCDEVLWVVSLLPQGLPFYLEAIQPSNDVPLCDGALNSTLLSSSYVIASSANAYPVLF